MLIPDATYRNAKRRPVTIPLLAVLRFVLAKISYSDLRHP